MRQSLAAKSLTSSFCYTEHMEIREVKESDIPALSQLAKRVFIDTFKDSLTKEDLEAELELNRSESYFREVINKDVILVAEEKGGLAGYVQFGEVEIPEINPEEGDQELRRIYVATEFQGKGIGRQLMDAAFSHPHLGNARNIYIDVWDKNEKAVNFYKKYGFKEFGKTDVYIGSKYIGQDLIMV